MNKKLLPDKIKDICEEIGANGRTISRQEILKEARKRGYNESSVLPADYCGNTPTGKHQPQYNFLHSVGRGKYKLSKFIKLSAKITK